MKIKLGKYKHYKGGEYEVIGVVKHSETLEEMVLYKSLVDSVMWVRPISMFLESVKVSQRKVKRFLFVK